MLKNALFFKNKLKIKFSRPRLLEALLSDS